VEVSSDGRGLFFVNKKVQENFLEHDKFKWKQESSRFFEKKRRKKLLFGWACDGETSTAQFKKVFLLLFVHKKKPSSSLRHDLS
jgi:hypothetical protein